MKKTARILSLLLFVAMVFGLMVVSAAAEETTPVVTITKSDIVDAEDTSVVTYDVTFVGNTGFDGFDWAITYTDDKAELVDIVMILEFKEAMMLAGNPETGLVSGAADEAYTVDGTMFQLVFKLNEGVAENELGIEINGEDTYLNFKKVTFTFVGIEPTVEDDTTGGSTTGGDDTGSDDEGDTTVETVLSTESEAAVVEGEVNETLKEAAGEDAVHYDVTLNVTVCTKGLDADAEHTDCDETRPATEEELKAYIEANGGIPVVLDIPEGTSPDTHTYVVYAIVDGEVVEIEVAINVDGKISALFPGVGSIALAWEKIVVEEPKAEFWVPRLFKVTVKVEEGGKVQVKGANIMKNPTIMVAFGASRILNIIPDEGYVVEDILVNGKSVGALDKYVLKAANKNYTIEVKFAESVEEIAG